MQLYSYFRSSAAYRVRIALNIKQLDYVVKPVSLLDKEHCTKDYLCLNPQGLVPTLITDDGVVLTQSLAICEYLDEVYPTHPLLPKDAVGRAKVRAMANLISCDIHPLNNLRVLNYLSDQLAVSNDQRASWYAHWLGSGFEALESTLAAGGSTEPYCYGEVPTLADIGLIPQVYNAKRFHCDLEAYPSILRIAAACNRITAFTKAQPDQSTDAP